MESPESELIVRRAADRARRDRFLTLAIAFEGGLALVAMVFGWWTDIHPLERFGFEWMPALAGIALALPLFVGFLLFFRFPFGPLHQIRRALMETLGAELAVCSWWELLVLAFVTGFSEEVLFRGLFQAWIGPLWSNLLFGLLHWITPLYAILAGGMGLLFSWSMTVTENLMTPILTHTVYDFLAFLVVARAARMQPISESDSPA